MAGLISRYYGFMKHSSLKKLFGDRPIFLDINKNLNYNENFTPNEHISQFLPTDVLQEISSTTALTEFLNFQPLEEFPQSKAVLVNQDSISEFNQIKDEILSLETPEFTHKIVDHYYSTHLRIIPDPNEIIDEIVTEQTKIILKDREIKCSKASNSSETTFLQIAFKNREKIHWTYENILTYFYNIGISTCCLAIEKINTCFRKYLFAANLISNSRQISNSTLSKPKNINVKIDNHTELLTIYLYHSIRGQAILGIDASVNQTWNDFMGLLFCCEDEISIDNHPEVLF